ncbi:hypothetical protein GOODEAATRI_018334 [Goodea atripinnis]|uniref:Uncharacterized protein n=1 Tax=Goodea atripinnis TaxID=208336 RepID=A0ABV0PPN4_9TELE
MCMALRQLQLELPLGEVSASGSAFFRCGRAPTPFSVRGVPEGVARLLAGPKSVVTSLHRQLSIGCHMKPCALMSDAHVLNVGLRMISCVKHTMQERVLAALAIPWHISCLPSLHPFRTLVVQLRQLGLAALHCRPLR